MPETTEEALVRVYSQLVERRARCDHLAVEVMDLTDERDRLSVIVDAAVEHYLAELRCDRSDLTPAEWQAANEARAEGFAGYEVAMLPEAERRRVEANQ